MESRFVQLLTARRFAPLFVTQFLGAFNDNLLKASLGIFVTYRLAESAGMDAASLVMLAGGLFIAPFFLFSGASGTLADRVDKAVIARWVKIAEMGIMAVGACGLWWQSLPILLVALFGLGTHSTVFGPIKYALLPHGASMGDKYGPILVSKTSFPALANGGSLKGVKVGVPGRLTSAFLTLQMYDPSFDFEIIAFDEIQDAVQNGRVDAGLLIHEGQLTYASEGLHKIVDLGEWWFERTGGLPLPLGGNVIRRDLGAETMARVSKMLHDSIAHALNHRAAAVEYAETFGRGLNRADTDKFVGMYVNQLTLDYGDRGRAALDRFFTEAFEKKLIPVRVPVEFV